MGGACCSSNEIPSRAALLDTVSPKRKRARSQKRTATDTHAGDDGDHRDEDSADESERERPKKKRSIFRKTAKPVPIDKDESFIDFSDDTNDSHHSDLEPVDHDDKVDGDMDQDIRN